MEGNWDRYDEDVDESGEDGDMFSEIPSRGQKPAEMICYLCDYCLPDSNALLAHLLSVGHNARLELESANKNRAQLGRLLEREVMKKKSSWRRKETILTKKFKYISPPKPHELEEGEIVDEDSDKEEGEIQDDDSDEEDSDEVDNGEKPVPKKKVNKESKTTTPATPVSRLDLRNKLNKMKEKQQEERKAEKRKKKNIRTREAKKRNKKIAKEEKKRIEEALEALEEEDENVAFMKHTMGFSKFQSTKRSYF